MAEISADYPEEDIPQPRKPLTRVPTPPPEPVTKKAQQQQQQDQRIQEQLHPFGDSREQEVSEEEGIPTKAYYTDEFDEARELRAKSMPIIYSYLTEQEQFAQLYGKDADPAEVETQYGPIKYRECMMPVMDTPSFNIKDIHVKDSKNKDVIGTFNFIFIKPHMQVLPLFMASKNTDPETQKRCIYEVMFGQGLLCIANLTKHVMKSDVFWIEPNVEHNFFNTSNQPLIIRMWYDGYVDLRDRYFPKQRAQQVAAESRREIFNVQEQKDVPVGQQGRVDRRKSEERFA